MSPAVDPFKRPYTSPRNFRSGRDPKEIYSAKDDLLLQNKVSYFERLAAKATYTERPRTTDAHWAKVRSAALIAQHLPKTKGHDEIIEGMDDKDLAKLRTHYASYCQFGSKSMHMDGGKFAKFCADAGISGVGNHQFTATDVDIVYMNARGHDPKLSFEGFMRALEKIAGRQKPPPPLPEFCAGVLAALDSGGAGVESFDKCAWKAELDEPSDVEGLRTLFEAFASLGGAKAMVDKKGRVLGYEMDITKFVKCCKDLGLFSGKFNQNSAERIFARCKPNGATKLSYTDFRWAVHSMAEEKSMAYYMLAFEMAERGPQAIKFTATKAQDVRQYQVKAAPTEVKERVNWKEGLDVPSDMENLEEVFDRFCAYGGGKPVVDAANNPVGYEMDGTRFAKLCRDCGVVAGKVTSSVIDSIYLQAKDGTRMTYEEFRWALYLLADFADTAYPAVAFGVVSMGPSALQLNNVTKADEVRFYEVKRQISRVRHRVNVDFRDGLDIPSEVDGLDTLFDFIAHSGGGKAKTDGKGRELPMEMDASRFSKLCRDLGVIDKRVPAAMTDSIFERVKTKGAKTINYLDFRWCVHLLAEAKGTTYHDFAYELTSKLESGAMFSNATKAEDVRLFEQRKEFIRVRSQVDWRREAAAQYEDTGGEPSDAEGLQALFEKVCATGGKKMKQDKATEKRWWEMDGTRFIKMCRDIGVVDDKGTTSAVVDMAFNKAKAKGQKSLSYLDFKWALHLLAEHRDEPYHILAYDLVQGSDKLFANATRAEDTHLYQIKKHHTAADIAKDTGDWREDPALKEELKQSGGVPSDADGLAALFERVCAGSGGKKRNKVTEGPRKTEGEWEIDASRFAKICRDTGLVGGKITGVAVDTVFVRAKASPQDHTLSYVGFRWALWLLAELRGEPYHMVTHHLATNADLLFANGTKADENNRFYEVKAAQGSATGGVVREWREDYKEQLSESGGVPSDSEGLLALFERVCASGGHHKTVEKVTKREYWDMSGSQFGKMVKDVGLLDQQAKGKKVTAATVDNCFTKACGKGSKKVAYIDFRWALLLVAEAMGEHYHIAVNHLVSMAPERLFANSTKAEDVRFYEQKKAPARATGGVAKDWKQGRTRPRDIDGLKQVYKDWTGKESFDPKTKKSIGFLMDGTHFSKMIAKSGQIDEALKGAEVDRVFLKVSPHAYKLDPPPPLASRSCGPAVDAGHVPRRKPCLVDLGKCKDDLGFVDLGKCTRPPRRLVWRGLASRDPFASSRESTFYPRSLA